MSINKMY